MKKSISVITVFAISLFLSSIIVVSTSFSKSQTRDVQTSPTGPVRKSPPSKDEPTLNKADKPVLVSKKAKSKFWDLTSTYGTANGTGIQRGNEYTIVVKVGEPLNCTFYYKMKTPKISDITEADANLWGRGWLTFHVAASIIYFNDPAGAPQWKKKTQRLPRFTYEDVKNWKKTMKGGEQKTWTSTLKYNWTPQEEHVGKDIWLQFMVNGESIDETDSINNSLCFYGGQMYGAAVVKITVTP